MMFLLRVFFWLLLLSAGWAFVKGVVKFLIGLTAEVASILAWILAIAGLLWVFNMFVPII